MQFVTVFKQEGIYAGWPANHGAWQWGDEFLVGFMIGRYKYEGNYAGHAIDTPYRKILARSMNGGITWDIDYPDVGFTGRYPRTPPKFDLLDPSTIIRVCGRYDTGGEDCNQLGAFYLSQSKGHSWRGPYIFAGLEALFSGSNHCTSRTRVVGDTVYLSTAKLHQWGTDWVFAAHHNGKTFEFDPDTDIICQDHYRAVMPAVANIEDRTIVTLRRKGRGCNWIDVVIKDTNGRWLLVARPDELQGIANTGFHNGNPPALARFGNRLVCAYANRTLRAMCFIYSDDKGITWSTPTPFDHGEDSDIGYPQLFVRNDRQGVCVYYFSNKGSLLNPQHIKACIFDPQTL